MHVTLSECSLHCARAFARNRTSKSFPVLEIFILKVGIFGQNRKKELQRLSNNSKMVKAMKNLIWFSECWGNSLLPKSSQNFHTSSSSWSNFDLKRANYDLENWCFWGVFEDFQPEYLCTWAQTSRRHNFKMSGADFKNHSSKFFVVLAKFNVKDCLNRKMA